RRNPVRRAPAVRPRRPGRGGRPAARSARSGAWVRPRQVGRVFETHRVLWWVSKTRPTLHTMTSHPRKSSLRPAGQLRRGRGLVVRGERREQAGALHLALHALAEHVEVLVEARQRAVRILVLAGAEVGAQLGEAEAGDLQALLEELVDSEQG